MLTKSQFYTATTQKTNTMVSLDKATINTFLFTSLFHYISYNRSIIYFNNLSDSINNIIDPVLYNRESTSIIKDLSLYFDIHIPI